MCQESLINYIQTQTSCSREDIEKFVHISDSILERDITATQKQKAIEIGEINLQNKKARCLKL